MRDFVLGPQIQHHTLITAAKSLCRFLCANLPGTRAVLKKASPQTDISQRLQEDTSAVTMTLSICEWHSPSVRCSSVQGRRKSFAPASRARSHGPIRQKVTCRQSGRCRLTSPLDPVKSSQEIDMSTPLCVAYIHEGCFRSNGKLGDITPTILWTTSSITYRLRIRIIIFDRGNHCAHELQHVRTILDTRTSGVLKIENS